MNIYLNKNCNGFKWFAVENLEKSEPNVLMTSPDINRRYPTLGNIMMWEEFSIILIHEGESYILSIDGLKENGEDSLGRPLNMKIIFIEDSYEKVKRILLAYVGHKNAFDKSMNEIFVRESGGIRCNTDLLKSTLENIYKADVEDFSCVEGKKLMFVETYVKDPKKFSQHFEIDLPNVNVVFRKCANSIMGMTFMHENPFITNAANKAPSQDIETRESINEDSKTEQTKEEELQVEQQKVEKQDPKDPKLKRTSLLTAVSIASIVAMAIVLLLRFLKHKTL